MGYVWRRRDERAARGSGERIENFSSDNPTKGEAFFDSSKLSEIAKEIQEIEFVYIGDKKWTLRAYKAPHRNEKDLLKEIDSEGNKITK